MPHAEVSDEMEALPARALAAAIPDPIVIVDGNAATRYANPAAVSAFGPIPYGTLLPHRFRAPEMRGLVASVLRDGRPGAVDYVERVPIERAFRVCAMPLAGDGGLFLVHFKDQSETRRIDRMRADFIANASHELRTPLASISGFIETLRGPARDDAGARDSFLAIMQAQTARMARLIDDLLSLSRIEMKPTMRPAEKVDLAAIVAGAVETLGHLADEYGVTVDFARPAEPVLVPGSRDELTQVFLNLIENACKYGQDGKRVEIVIGRSQAGPARQATVTVRDHGPGIAEEHIPRLTERFYRVDAETSRVKNGTGLGLAIVKHILTRHDGRLTIRSRPGEGAAFTVHLPLD
jgi:two-component system phosphate regulon sensor histidine kinase PhoR